VRIQNSQVRGALLCCVTLGACLVGIRPAVAEVTLMERDGWTFFTDGRVNVFGSVGFGDGFPKPTLNTNVDPITGLTPQHQVSGSGQDFTAGFYSAAQQNANGKYLATRVRSGFLGSVLAFGTKRQITENTSARAYVSLWGTAESFGRDRIQDIGGHKTGGFDVREGYLSFDGPWGTFGGGHISGIFGGISTEIDYVYAHAYALGLPCLDVYYPTCGHVGTGAISPGFAAGFVYTTPDVNGFKLRVGLYDPVRLLGAWNRAPYPRPEGAAMYERKLSPAVWLKLQVEGMYQLLYQEGAPESTSVWGVAAGGRLEAGPMRLGLSAFRGRGLGVYVALQNSGATFPSGLPGSGYPLRSFTGLYAQTAYVNGPWQVSLGAGQLMDDQLAIDKTDVGTSNLKTQRGGSFVLNYAISNHLVLDADYFLFQTKWWGAPNAKYNGTDSAGAPVLELLPGYLTPEKQLISFVNVGATFHW
jgi:hypothetical protein